MADNVFAEVLVKPYSLRDGWFPLRADNDNAPLGVDLPSFAAYRRVSVAAMFVIIRRSPDLPTSPIDTPPGTERLDGRRTLLGRVQHWFLSDPA